MILLSKIYQTILMESAAITDIQDSIINHNIVEIQYDDGIPGIRQIEPYVYGAMKNGNAVIRAYQISGPTKTKNNQWKIFRLDKIKSYTITEQTFEFPRPLFNKFGDKTFDKVYLIAKFNNKSFIQKAGDALKTGIGKIKSIFKSHHEKTLDKKTSLMLESFLHNYNLKYEIKNDNVVFKQKKNFLN